jgi:glycosyltransferase involved in cell wall biosynthesis
VEPRLQGPHVTCLGCIGTEQKVPLLRDARALLAPVAWNEPFGLTLIEAMLSGCPVVAYGLGSIPELIEPGVTGFIAGSLEDMVRLIRPGGPVDRLDRRVIRAVATRRFNHRRMAAEYEDLYCARSPLADGGKPRPVTAA